MTVTKLPTNDSRYSPKSSVDHYLNQLKSCENGTSGYTKLSKEDRPVPVHLPSVDRNGGSRSNSISDISISKTLSEPASLAKPAVEKSEMSASLTTKIPSERLASIRSQLDPNNPIGKILEKSTVIHVENGDADHKERRRFAKTGPDSGKDAVKNDVEKQVKTPKHTNNYASYIQISQPVSSANHKTNDENEELKTESHKKAKSKYIDADLHNRSLVLENGVESPSGTGFENKTFEHENYLLKRGVDETDCKVQEKMDRTEIIVNGEDESKQMETSTESTASDLTEDSGSETPSRRNAERDYEKSVSLQLLHCTAIIASTLTKCATCYVKFVSGSTVNCFQCQSFNYS